jgi:hypothetical protein
MKTGGNAPMIPDPLQPADASPPPAASPSQGGALGKYLVLTVAALGLLGLHLWNISRSLAVKQQQADFRAAQEYLNQSAPLVQLNEKIVARLAVLALERKDEALKNLLAEHGVTFNLEPAKAPGNPPAANKTGAR